ncbi:hypothetical protein F7725_024651 [Dissostichus mawsoni]|uniref:Uncharacterized protein n=1 Tax=Dissostichus mawsoni TaxID=36200 RepID=A0A7J5XA13_DISMA|nr:hypothetical protein F7725_024651 [Dissostichus mawsoni]
MCLRGLLLVSGLFLSSWALTPEECQPLVTPLSLADPSMMYAKPNFLAGYNDNKVFRAILNETQSSWVEISASPLSPQEFHILPSSDSILVMSINSTASNFKKLLEMMQIDIEDTVDEISFHALYLLGRETTLSDSDMEEFKKQASCLGFSGEPHYIYNPENGLLLVSELFLSSWALTPEECQPLVTPLSLADPSMVRPPSGREATLKDSDLEEFKKQASCLGFSGEPQFIYNPENGLCTEEESIKV